MSKSRPSYWQSTPTDAATTSSRPLSELIDQEQQENLKQHFNIDKSQPLPDKNSLKEVVQQVPFTPFSHNNLSGQTVIPTSENIQPRHVGPSGIHNTAQEHHQDNFNATSPTNITEPFDLNSPGVPSRLRSSAAMGSTDDDGSVFSFLVHTPTSAHPPDDSFLNTPAGTSTRSLRSDIHSDTPTQSGLGSYSSATAAALGGSQINRDSYYGTNSLIRAIHEDDLSSTTSDSEYEDEYGQDMDRTSYVSQNDTSNSILNPRDHLNSVFIQDPDILVHAGRPRLGAQSPPPVFPLPNSPNNPHEAYELQPTSNMGGHMVYNQPSQETVVSRSQRLNQNGANNSFVSYDDALQEKPPAARLSESSSRYNNSEITGGMGTGLAGAGVNPGPIGDEHTETRLVNGQFGNTNNLPPTKPEDYEEPPSGGESLWKRKKKLWILLIALACLAVILIAVLVPVGVLVIGKKSDNNSSSTDSSSNSSGSSGSSDSSGSSTSSSSSTMPSSLKGSIYDISTWKDKTDFNTTYTGVTVGGLPIMGLNSSWDNSVQPNPTVPSIDEGFTYGDLPIRGVNLGGWLVLEPFITPSIFSKYDLSEGIVDEWTLIDHINSTEGIDSVVDLMETHYSTFVTESTFQEIQEAGLDHVRIPFGYWAVQTWDDEHFLPQISWRYLLRGIEWARKYGLRVNVDLHSAPGGQNGWNHSGRQNVVQWLNGANGTLYGDRTLEIHQQVSKFFAQDRYKNLVTIYGLVNEPRMQDLNVTVVIDWTKNATNLVRDQGYEGVVVFGDGFLGVDTWKGIYPESDFPNMALDVHQYTIFDVNLLAMSHSAKINYVCAQWASQITRSSSTSTGHGPTFVGEWSQADNDCTLYLNNVGVGSRWEGDYVPTNESLAVTTMTCNGGVSCSCNVSNSDPSTYSDEYKQFLLDFAEVQMDVFESGGGWGSMYWAWDTETIESSQWSYKKARDAGIMPQTAYNRTFNCSSGTPDYLSLGLPEYI